MREAPFFLAAPKPAASACAEQGQDDSKDDPDDGADGQNRLALHLVVVEGHAVRAVARADDLNRMRCVAAEPIRGAREGDLVILAVEPAVDPAAVVVVPAEEAVSRPPRVVGFPIVFVIPIFVAITAVVLGAKFAPLATR